MTFFAFFITWFIVGTVVGWLFGGAARLGGPGDGAE